jgi:hypothetical protein
LSVAIAEKSRVSWLSVTCGTDAELPELLELLDDAELPLAAELLPLLLQAAAARHKATDTDATAAPFLAIRIIKTTLRLKGRAASRHAYVLFALCFGSLRA